jgi:hypothetical protein
VNLRRALIPAVAAITAVALLPSPARATLFPGFPTGSDRQALSIEDLVDNPFSFIVNNNLQRAMNSGKAVETPEATRLCDEFNTRGCNLQGDSNLTINSIIPVCASTIENCINSLQITKSDGTKVNAKFVRYFKGKTFSGLPALGMPGGSRTSLWEAPSATNAGGTDLYLVNAKVLWDYRNGSASVSSFNSSVYAVKEKSDPGFKDSGIEFGPNQLGKFASITETGEILYDGSCVATEAGNCAQRVEFIQGTRVKLEMTLSNKVTGWLHGRISNPDITVLPIDNTYNKISVEANVVDVPMMYAAFNQSEMSKSFLAGYEESMWIGRGLNGRSFWRQFPPSNPFAQEIINTLASSLKNTATELHSYWDLASLPNDSNNACLSDTSKLIGFVTTNAMAYSGNTPTWDGSSLEYKVAGLHFLPDGKTLTSGTYDLAMRSDTARCLYGFTSAPISASISVSSSDGEQKVATTLLNEKNGWLYLAAYGFSFSSPTIKIKLSQEKTQQVSSSPAPSTAATALPSPIPLPTSTAVASPSPSNTPKAQLAKTVKCFKGKIVKLIKGINPKCPQGYRTK